MPGRVDFGQSRGGQWMQEPFPYHSTSAKLSNVAVALWQAEPAAERWSREAAKAVVKLETAVWPGSEHLRTTCAFSHCKRIKRQALR